MTHHLSVLVDPEAGRSRDPGAAAPLGAPDVVGWQDATAAPVALLSALRLLQGRLHAAGRRGPSGGAAAGSGVEAEQAVLQSLCDAGPLPLVRLAERLRRNPRAVRVLVARLAERGLVEIRPNAGRRSSPVIAITSAGRQASHRPTDRELAALERAVADWSRLDCLRFEELVTRLADTLAPSRRG